MESNDIIDKHKTFNILSIDGGGILGLYSAEILALIEKELFKNDKTFSNKFNLIAGTSTGGIIALALALDCSPAQVSEFYKMHGEKIFSKSYFNYFFKNWIFTNRYSSLPLHNALDKFFGDKTVKDCKTNICIPAIDVSNCQPIIFKTNHNGNLTRDIDVKLTDIALATSAAPTYFPLHRFGHYRGLADGGLWQNNPALFAVIEACTYFVGEGKVYDSINILSIGNPLSAIKETISVETRKSGLIKWAAKMVSMPMKISSFGVHNIINFLSRNEALSIHKYLRIESEDLPDKPECKKLSLDYANNKTYRLLSELSFNDFNKNKTDIINFFKE
ncbi:patatin-like phospholipase family protein [Treponema denticola]|uniref:CBASS cGAMP-activated phospholipase n=1 Tax=Treponema denticola TaxID=158 RepID=UPI003D023EA8